MNNHDAQKSPYKCIILFLKFRGKTRCRWQHHPDSQITGRQIGTGAVVAKMAADSGGALYAEIGAPDKVGAGTPNFSTFKGCSALGVGSMVYVPIRAINNSHEVPPELPSPVLNVHLDHYITGLLVMEEIPLNLRLNTKFVNYFFSILLKPWI